MFPLALITGGSRGIGRGIALELAHAGRHDVLINYAGNEAAARECQRLCIEACAGSSGGNGRAVRRTNYR